MPFGYFRKPPCCENWHHRTLPFQHMDHLETSKPSVSLFLYQTYKWCCQHKTDNNISLAVLRESSCWVKNGLVMFIK